MDTMIKEIMKQDLSRIYIYYLYEKWLVLSSKGISYKRSDRITEENKAAKWFLDKYEDSEIEDIVEFCMIEDLYLTKDTFQYNECFKEITQKNIFIEYSELNIQGYHSIEDIYQKYR